MKRNKKEEKFKAYLRKKVELRANRDAQHNLGYKPLDKPIHHGYTAVWKLRADIARRDDADFLNALLEYDTKSVWCRDNTFKKWDKKQKKELDIKPYFIKIPESEYDNYYPRFKKWYKHDLGYDVDLGHGVIKRFYVLDIPEYWLELDIEKYYSTHYKVIDEVLKQEEAEIKSYIGNHYYVTDRWHGNPPKEYRKSYIRSERCKNKTALKKNMNHIFAKYDDINDDWGSWLSDWSDEVVEFKYNHKHSARWDWW